MSLRARFLELDDALATHGVPPLTAWWREGVSRWLDAYETGQVLELWACVGRGAAKSTCLYKLALFFTLFGEFTIAPGERHYAIVLSRLVEEATKGLKIIDAWLTMLGAPHRLAGDVIELVDMPRGVRVVAASVAASSGWRSYFIAKDERSKWPSSGIEELDAEEIDTSAAAMTATHPTAPVLSFGSAWGAFGRFYDAITSGTDSSKVVLGPAPSWVAAPHLDREALRRKERDPKKFAREYESVFQSAATSALDPDQVRACLRPCRMGHPLSAPFVGFDSSMGRGDAAAWVLAQWGQPEFDESELYEYTDVVEHGVPMRIMTEGPGGNRKRKATAPEPMKPELFVHGIGALTGKFASRGITSDDVVDAVADCAHRAGARHILSDQYQGFAYTSAFAHQRLAYSPQTWSAETKGEALLRLRTWLRDGTLAIEPGPEGEALVRELLNLQETIRPSGSIGLGARRGHDDRACALLSIAMGDSVGFLAGSPIRKPQGLIVDAPGQPTRYFGGA